MTRCFLLQGDGRPFWRYAVATATGCSDEAYFEELYQVIIYLTGESVISHFRCGSEAHS